MGSLIRSIHCHLDPLGFRENMFNYTRFDPEIAHGFVNFQKNLSYPFMMAQTLSTFTSIQVRTFFNKC